MEIGLVAESGLETHVAFAEAWSRIFDRAQTSVRKC